MHSRSLPFPTALSQSVFGATRVLRAEGQQRQVQLSFALYSSANPTYVNHQGPVGENIAQFP